MKHFQEIKTILDKEVCHRNTDGELSFDRPDPLLIAQKLNDEFAILLCALFAYGNANLIVKFLDSLDFDLLNASEEKIENTLKNHYYRFQKNEDVINIFKTLRRLKQENSLEDVFLQGYKKENSVLEGIDTLIHAIYNIFPNESYGYSFLLSKPLKRDKKGYIKYIGNAPYKRWNMFLRWMVRKDNLDLGFWKKVDKKNLVLPLDTHTFTVSQKLGLLSRKTYDLKSAIEITEVLKTFDKKDPIKYDFALYRIGQEKII